MRLLVVGAGGHAKVVVDAAEEAGWEIAAVVGLGTDASDLLGHRVIRSPQGVDADGFIVAIGSNPIRGRYYEEYCSTGMTPASVIHPSAVISDRVDIGGGTFIAAGVVVNVDAVIGKNVILNTSCAVDHDVVVGDHSLVGPGAVLCGNSAIGSGVLVGAGSTVIPGKTIGEWSVCGAGAVVVSDLPAKMLCVGVPAVAVRAVEE